MTMFRLSWKIRISLFFFRTRQPKSKLHYLRTEIFLELIGEGIVKKQTKFLIALLSGLLPILLLSFMARVSAESQPPTFPELDQQIEPPLHENNQSNINILYSQLATTGSGAGSQVWDNFPTYSTYVTDDFVVPLGSTWVITGVSVVGQSYISDFTPVNIDVGFFSDNSGMPSSQPTTASMNPDLNFTDDAPPYDVIVDSEQNSFKVALETPLEISACNGDVTVWLSVAPDQLFDSTGTRAQWLWNSNNGSVVPIRGYEFHLNNPGGSFGYPNGWNPISQLNSSGNQIDLAFALMGIEDTNTCEPLSVELTTASSVPNPQLATLFISIFIVLLGLATTLIHRERSPVL